MDGLRIGELARRAGVTVKAVRVHERRGILTPPARVAVRYRIYGGDAVEMLHFITPAAGLGRPLAGIKAKARARRP